MAINVAIPGPGPLAVRAVPATGLETVNAPRADRVLGLDVLALKGGLGRDDPMDRSPLVPPTMLEAEGGAKTADKVTLAKGIRTAGAILDAVVARRVGVTRRIHEPVEPYVPLALLVSIYICITLTPVFPMIIVLHLPVTCQGALAQSVSHLSCMITQESISPILVCLVTLLVLCCRISTQPLTQLNQPLMSSSGMTRVTNRARWMLTVPCKEQVTVRVTLS